MTIIRNTDTGELVEIELIYRKSGADFLFDVIAGCGNLMSGEDGVDFELDGGETAWWIRWAGREQRINDSIDELGIGDTIPNFYDEYPDWEDAQTAYEQYLGIQED